MTKEEAMKIFGDLLDQIFPGEESPEEIQEETQAEETQAEEVVNESHYESDTVVTETEEGTKTETTEKRIIVNQEGGYEYV